MELIDNVTSLLGDDLKNTVRPKSKVRIAASCFSIYAFEALKKELERVDSLEFIFTSPTFVLHEVNKAQQVAASVCEEMGLPKTVAEIAKERLRRCAKSVREQMSGTPILGLADTGFRVLKIDTSNMKDVYYQPDALRKDDLFTHVDNIKEDRTPEDLLFQVLLDWGVELTLPIEQESIDGKTVFFVDQNALAACFDTGVTEDLVKKLALRKPMRVVFRDSGFSDDSVKINVEQIFKLMSPGSEVKSI